MARHDGQLWVRKPTETLQYHVNGETKTVFPEPYMEALDTSITDGDLLSIAYEGSAGVKRTDNTVHTKAIGFARITKSDPNLDPVDPSLPGTRIEVQTYGSARIPISHFVEASISNSDAGRGIYAIPPQEFDYSTAGGELPGKLTLDRTKASAFGGYVIECGTITHVDGTDVIIDVMIGGDSLGPVGTTEVEYKSNQLISKYNTPRIFSYVSNTEPLNHKEVMSFLLPNAYDVTDLDGKWLAIDAFFAHPAGKESQQKCTLVIYFHNAAPNTSAIADDIVSAGLQDANSLLDSIPSINGDGRFRVRSAESIAFVDVSVGSRDDVMAGILLSARNALTTLFTYSGDIDRRVVITINDGTTTQSTEDASPAFSSGSEAYTMTIETVDSAITGAVNGGVAYVYIAPSLMQNEPNHEVIVSKYIEQQGQLETPSGEYRVVPADRRRILDGSSDPQKYANVVGAFYAPLPGPDTYVFREGNVLLRKMGTMKGFANLEPGGRVYLGYNGHVTQRPQDIPYDEYIVEIGVARSATEIDIYMSDPKLKATTRAQIPIGTQMYRAKQDGSSPDLGTAAWRDVTSSAADTTSGRVLKVGDGGLLARSLNVNGYETDIDDLQSSYTRFTAFRDTTINQPAGLSTFGNIIHLQRTSTGGESSLIMCDVINRIFYRRRAAGTTTDLELLHTSNTGTAVTRDVTTSATDTTEGRVLKVGDGGWLSQRVPSVDSETEEQNIVATRFYRTPSAANTGFPQFGSGLIFPGHSSQGNALTRAILFVGLNGDGQEDEEIYLRTYRNDSTGWRPVRKLLHTGNTGTAVTRDVTTSSTDTTSGRLLKVGDFGIGRQGKKEDSQTRLSDIDEQLFNGLYVIDAATVDGVKPFANGSLIHSAHNDVRASQIAFNVEQDEVKFRTQTANSVWRTWQELYHTGNTGTAVTRDVTTSSTDTTSGRLLKVGDGGLLGNAVNMDFTQGPYYSGFVRDINNRLGFSDNFRAIMVSRNDGAGCLIGSNIAGSSGDNDVVLYARTTSAVANDWGPIVELLHTGNTGTAVTRDVGPGAEQLPTNADISAAPQDFTVGRDVSATRNVNAGQDVSATRDVNVGRNLTVSSNVAIAGALAVAGASPLSRIQTLSGSGSWTVPSNVYTIRAFLSGGGGGGVGWDGLGDRLPGQAGANTTFGGQTALGGRGGRVGAASGTNARSGFTGANGGRGNASLDPSNHLEAGEAAQMILVSMNVTPGSAISYACGAGGSGSGSGSGGHYEGRKAGNGANGFIVVMY